MNGYTVKLDISRGRLLPREFMECLALEDLKPSLAIILNLLLPSICLAKIQSHSPPSRKMAYRC